MPCSSAAAPPRARSSSLPGREEGAAHIHIGIDWLESIAFGHVNSIGKRVLIIGVGNTAMDCCRSSLRLGANDVKVMARKPRASSSRPPTGSSRTPRRSASRSSSTTRRRRSSSRAASSTACVFEKLEYDLDDGGPRSPSQQVVEEVFLPCRRRRARHRPGKRLPVDRARPRHRVRQVGRAGGGRDHVPVHPARACSSAAMRRSARRTSSGRSSTAIRPPSRSTATARARTSTERLPRGVNLASTKMGLHEWSYSNGFDPSARRMMPHVDLQEAVQEARHRGGARLHRRAGRDRGRALPQLRHPDRVHRPSCASSATPASTSARWTA